eukprot:m.68663 g.68663  ORF g.68663 m.68663 type:complete len:71 (-) comp13690_c0_seq6:41-253(-)
MVLSIPRFAFTGSNYVSEQKGHTGFLTFATRPHESLVKMQRQQEAAEEKEQAQRQSETVQDTQDTKDDDE